MKITPLNGADLLEEALALDGKEPGEHVEALRAQFRQQVMAGYADRAEEREIRNRRPRGPAYTPPKPRPPAVICRPLTEKSDAEVLHAFDRVKAGIAKAIAYGKRNPQLHKSMEAITAELQRRGMWVGVLS